MKKPEIETTTAKPTKELFPETYQKAMQRKAALESGTLQNIQITVPSGVVNWFCCICWVAHNGVTVATNLFREFR